MVYEETQVIVDRAAELLPDPPRPDNSAGYAGWAALTIDTGCQLARVLGADADLIRSLSRDERRTPVASRPRRRLLLKVALFAALEESTGEWTAGGIPRRPMIVGSVIQTPVNDQSPVALRLGRPDAA
jgi:hypothetical protein